MPARLARSSWTVTTSTPLPVAVDTDAPHPVAHLAQARPRPRRRKASDDLLGGTAHPAEQISRVGHVVIDTESYGDVVSIDFVNVSPGPLLDRGQTGILGRLGLG